MNTRLAPLDGIRALAVTAVIAFHFTSLTQFPLDALGPLATPVVHGWIGVDVFFGLSGFLITRLWLADEASARDVGRATQARLFYARRALRILPVYYVTLFGLLLLARVVPYESIAPMSRRVGKHWTTLLPYVFFFVNYVPFARDGAFGARWSLCIEEHFYAVWPCVLLAVRSLSRRRVVAIAVCVALLVERTCALLFADHRHGWGSNMMVHYATHMRIDSIMWGCVAALFYDELARAERLRRGALVLAVAASIALVATGLMTPVRPPTVLGSGVGPSVLAIAAALLSTEVTAAPRSLLARALGVLPLPTIGFHSYAMYLVHPFAVDVTVALVFRKVTTASLGLWVLGVVLTTFVSFVLAFALHFVVDRPLRSVRARLHPHAVQ